MVDDHLISPSHQLPVPNLSMKSWGLMVDDNSWIEEVRDDSLNCVRRNGPMMIVSLWDGRWWDGKLWDGKIWETSIS